MTGGAGNLLGRVLGVASVVLIVSLTVASAAAANVTVDVTGTNDTPSPLPSDCDFNASPATCQTLRDAVLYSPSGATIEIASGTYEIAYGELEFGSGDAAYANPGGTLTIDAAAGATGIRLSPTPTVLSRVIGVDSGATLTMDGSQSNGPLVVSGGRSQSSPFKGGNILNAGTLTLSYIDVTTGEAESSDPTAEAEGGDIANSGTLTIGNSTIANGLVYGATPSNAGNGAGAGGGIYESAGTLMLTDTVLDGNFVLGGEQPGVPGYGTGGPANGGGIEITGGTTTISGGSMYDNDAEGGDGATDSSGSGGGSGGSATGGAIDNNANDSGTLTLTDGAQVGVTGRTQNEAAGGTGGAETGSSGNGGAGGYAYGGGIAGAVTVDGSDSIDNNFAVGGLGGAVSTGAGNGGAGGWGAGGGVYGAPAFSGASGSAQIARDSAAGGQGGAAASGNGGLGGEGYGGGIAVLSGALTDLTIEQDAADAGYGGSSSTGAGGSAGSSEGGGIAAGEPSPVFNQVSPGGLVTVTDSTISGNGANGGAGGLPGGAGSPSASGGGIWTSLAYPGLDVEQSLIDNNTTDGGNYAQQTGGGGIEGATDGNLVLTLVNDTIYENSAGSASSTGAEGGGIEFTANTGGAGSPTLTMKSSTVFSNLAQGTASSGGNLASVHGGVTVQQTILAGGTAASGSDCTGIGIQDDGYNLTGAAGDGCATLTGATGDVTGSPDFTVPATNGGPTQTLAPQSVTAPEVDGGPAGCNGVTVDQRGDTRGSPCDIGAYEDLNPPSGVMAPTFGGKAEVGSSLTCYPGPSNGPEPGSSDAYLWKRDGSATTDTTNTYAITDADAGHLLACDVTESNDDGSAAPASAGVTVITLTTPATGTYTNVTEPTFRGIGGVAAGDGKVTVQLYMGPTALGTPFRSLSATPAAGTGAYSVAPTTALPDGEYTAQATQALGAGVQAISGATTFSVETIAPPVTLTAPAAESRTTNTKPTFSGTAGNLSGGLPAITVKLYRGSSASGTPVQTLMTAEAGGKWSVAASAVLAPGTYTVTASQSDRAGNTRTTAPVTFAIVPVAKAACTAGKSHGHGKKLKTPVTCTASGLVSVTSVSGALKHGAKTLASAAGTVHTGRVALSFSVKGKVKAGSYTLVLSERHSSGGTTIASFTVRLK
jgi:hypothetical protein